MSPPRGNERKPIFRDDADRFHCLELLADLGERFGTGIQAYVPMDNHFHLLLETPEGNLSRAMHWLEVSCSVWSNRHNRAGHLFQGRFKAVVVEGDAGWPTSFRASGPLAACLLGVCRLRQGRAIVV
jgi:REP element-mobilizing transposase RayT